MEVILEWMMAGGVQDISGTDVVFQQAVLLLRNMEEVKDFYKTFFNPNIACHRWHYMTEDGVLHAHSRTIYRRACGLCPPSIL